jgi:superfamily II helicase
MLPAAIESESVRERLENMAAKERDASAVLNAVDKAFDPNHQKRAESIEYLANNKVQLHPNQVQDLLNDDSPRIRKYALALVDDAYYPEKLKEKVEKMSNQDSSQSVQDEAALLLEYI